MDNQKASPEDIKRKQERFKKLGLPEGAGTMMDTTAVQANPTGNKFSKLEELRRGGKKNEFKKFIEATEKKSAAQGFQIPETKKNHADPNAHKVKAEHAVDVDTFSSSQEGSSELQMLEGMLGGTPGSPVAPSSYQEKDVQLDIEGVNSGMPSFNPLAHLRQKAGVQHPQSEQLIQEQEVGNQSVGMRNMMIEIAKEISENTMKRFLNEQNTSQQKGLEIYDANRNLFKVGSQIYMVESVSPMKLIKVRLK